MAIRHIDSFDTYQTADLAKKYNTSSGAIAAGGRQSSAYSASTSLGISKTLDAQATWIVGFAVKPTSLGSASLVEFLTGSTVQCSLYLNADGTLSMRTSTNSTLATSTSAMSTGTWYYIEVKVTIGNSGTYQVKVNGVDWIASATGDTQAHATTTTANVILLGAVSLSAAALFDDYYICDGSGTANNDFLGDIRVDAVFPAADSATNAAWTCSAGTDHYALVDEKATDFPDDDTTYISSDTADQKDTFDMEALSYANGTILGVQVCVCARKDDAGPRSIAATVKSGASDDDGDTVSLGNSYEYIKGANNSLPIWETDPATSAAWTLEGVENAEFGVKLVA